MLDAISKISKNKSKHFNNISKNNYLGFKSKEHFIIFIGTGNT